ncbi:MAG: nicotinate-nucleotide adenylyltransferase [Deltaproteobacteria bacterium]|nr:nicotinate-nucleotide adenylyltransferase [Deltaproteobacteria bacterium]
MKIGLFGGTFDPIHWGHLRSAEEVREAFALDRVIFIPASVPPHKRRKPTTSPEQRLHMVRLAIRGNPHFRASSIELQRPGKSYSIDTIRYFSKRNSAKDSVYFVLGLDAFESIDSWKNVTEIFPLCHLIVTSRPGSGDRLSLGTIPVAVRGGFCYDPGSQVIRHQSGKGLYFCRLTDIGISASEIRKRLAKGKSIRYLVPQKIETYIKNQALYQAPQEEPSRD